MSTKNFVPQLWAATILRTLEDNLVAKKICTTQYTGEIKSKGDTVHFNGLAEPTISPYTGSTISYEALQDSRISLVVDQSDMFAFKVGDIEKVQSGMDIKGSQAQRAGYQLTRSCDTYIMGLYGQAGNTITSATITSANVLSVLGSFEQQLAENNVSDNQMWMVIPPWLRLKLELAGIKFQINNGLNKTGGMAWCDQLGFTVYVTNQVKNTGTIATPVSHIIAGSGNAIGFADQITETEDIRLESTFDTAVRGLHVYGARVIKPLELATGALTFGGESTI